MTESLLNDIRVLRRENEWLREQLARSDQQIEWLSRGNDTITSLELEIDQLERNNEYLRGRIAFLEKVLNSKPGTVHFGREGFYLRGVDGEAT